MTPEQEIVAQALAREDFYFFVRYIFLKQKKFKWLQAPHHKTICDALMRVYNGEINRLIINLPPRSGKTELAKMFEAWTLGKQADCEYINVSYSATLVSTTADEIRAILQMPEYQAIFPLTKIRKDYSARNDWKTTAGGVVYSDGVGGSLTGRGAGKVRDGYSGGIIVDDPHKPIEASSDLMRNRVINWFGSTLHNRRNNPRVPIIVIMQRLHEADLAGWLLAGGTGEHWENVVIEAITETGESFWEEKFPIADLLLMQDKNPYVFAGQFMQRPAPVEGGMFKVGRFTVVEQIPEGRRIKWVRGWDFAASDGSKSDYTVGAKIGQLDDGRFIIADIAREQFTTNDRDNLLKNTAISDGRLVHQDMPQDPGAAGKSQVVYFSKLLSGFAYSFSPESGSKVERASPLASTINSGNVLILAAPWNDALRSEFSLFPFGKHDDIVDACSRSFNKLMERKAAGNIDQSILDNLRSGNGRY
jgi:predicted phage terminase large subunit-like protein